MANQPFSSRVQSYMCVFYSDYITKEGVIMISEEERFKSMLKNNVRIAKTEKKTCAKFTRLFWEKP